MDPPESESYENLTVLKTQREAKMPSENLCACCTVVNKELTASAYPDFLFNPNQVCHDLLTTDFCPIQQCRLASTVCFPYQA